MDNHIVGFFGFDIDGDIKLAEVPSPFDSFAPTYIDWIRTADRDEMLRMVSTLRTIPRDATGDKIAQAFGYDSADAFASMVGDLPDGILDEALGSPHDMLYNGVVYGTTKPSEFKTAEYGFIINLTQGVLECYLGNQLAHHEEGAFFLVDPFQESGTIAEAFGAKVVDVYPPRLYATYDWDSLPPKSEFLEAHRRAVTMQHGINEAWVRARLDEQRPARVSLMHASRGDDFIPCGKIVQRSGMPCLLRAQHKGKCRSI